MSYIYSDDGLEESESNCYKVTYVTYYGESNSSNIACAVTDGPILGCTYAWACNYNPQATVDDGSCLYPSAEVTPESFN